VRAKVEVIVTTGTPATLAAKRATTTIPIVFSSAGGPVTAGLVDSLARPGGNVTGASIVSPEITAKYLSLLKETLPGLQRIAVLVVSTNPWVRATRTQFEQTCRSLGLEPVFVEIAAPGEIQDAITEVARQGGQALVLGSEPFVWDNRFEIVDAALKHRLPIFAEQDDIVREADALISYYANIDQARQVAKYVDRILRGARPADLPVEQPTRFELVINLKAARKLGITVPQSVLLRADVVIR
jgi:putative ABC transport system substrate-binding protein